MNESSYRGPAGPETDAAWSALGIDCKSRPTIAQYSLIVQICQFESPNTKLRNLVCKEGKSNSQQNKAVGL